MWFNYSFKYWNFFLVFFFCCCHRQYKFIWFFFIQTTVISPILFFFVVSSKILYFNQLTFLYLCWADLFFFIDLWFSHTQKPFEKIHSNQKCKKKSNNNNNKWNHANINKWNQTFKPYVSIGMISFDLNGKKNPMGKMNSSSKVRISSILFSTKINIIFFVVFALIT